MTRIVIANNTAALREALAPYKHSATVEAEYGDTVVEGTDVTLAHHGPRAHRPCPCLEPNRRLDRIDAIGVSHVDLDTVGGIMALMDRKPYAPSFWPAAAYVDTHGPHRLAGYIGHPARRDARACTTARLWAYWAFSDSHRVFAPRDGSALDVTDAVREHIDAVQAIIAGNLELLAAGREKRERTEQLEKDSFTACFGGAVLLRETPGPFVNSLYVYDGNCARAVVAYNSERHNVTVSLEHPIAGVSCRDFVQELWGPEAGGHTGIAGSPRDQEMTIENASSAAALLLAAIYHAEEG